VRQWGRKVVLARGVLPWTIGRMTRGLKREIREGSWHRARVTGGRLGHYVADAYMPLHLTVNHDGQFTGQRGIHHRVENLVDAGLADYSRLVAAKTRVRRIEISAVEETVFAEMIKSYGIVKEIMGNERRIRARHEPGSSEYSREMQEALKPVLAGQLARAASTLAGIWVAACRGQ